MRVKLTLLLVLAVIVAFGCQRAGQTDQPGTVTPAASQPATAAAPAAVPPAAVPASKVADLPDYPNGLLARAENEAKAGQLRETEAAFTTTDSFDTVRAFYQKAIAEGGWQVASTEEKPGRKVEWRLTKGSSLGKVAVEAEHGAVKIKLERKDR